MPRYIILSESLFSSRDWDRFGCEELRRHGYQVQPVQIAVALGSRPPQQNANFFSIDGIVEPGGLDALEGLLSDIGPADIVLVESRLSKITWPLFQILRRRAVKYVAVDLGNLPQHRMKSLRAALSWTEYLRLLANDLGGFLHRLKALGSLMVFRGFEYFRLQPPSMWFTAGEGVSGIGSGLPKYWQAHRISVPSFDWLAVQAAQEAAPRKALADQGTAVFLDEAFLDHPDFGVLDLARPVTERYWAQLETFFEAVETKTGLRVIIAPHPKSSGLIPEKSRSRMGAIGSTSQLVRDCRLVLCHASTSVSYAVLFRKPLLFVTTDEIERSHFGKPIARMSGCFARRRLNADRFTPDEIEIPPVDERKYRAYEAAYLRAPDAIALSPWEFMRRHALSLPAEGAPHGA